MSLLASLYRAITGPLDRVGMWLMPLAARFVFAATLSVYYWHSGLTKLGNGVFGFLHPSVGAYAQIFPKQIEAAGYDISQISVFYWAVVVVGTWAEFILPALIVLGLGTRLAALGMIGFITMQSLTDVYGHDMRDLKTLGAWFDRFPDSVIMDQRFFWVFLLAFLVVKGAGVLSVDAMLRRRFTPPDQ